MASIKIYCGNKCLVTSGSEAIYKSIDIPTGSIDLRFGCFISTSGNYVSDSPIPNGTAQKFENIQSVYESFNFIFTSGNENNVFSGSYIGIGSEKGNSTLISRYNQNVSGFGRNHISLYLTSGSNPNFFSTSSNIELYNKMVGSSAIYDIYFSENTSINNYSSSAFILIRLYKNEQDETMFEYRKKDGPLSNTVPNVRLTSTSDSTTNQYLTDLSLTTLICSSSVTSSYNNLIEEMNGIFISWPFYDVPLYIPAIGYRAIS